MAQFGFLFDQSRCIGCNACVVACKQWHHIQPGPVKWMRVYQWEKGRFPNTKVHILAIPCLHCENPLCVKACPNRALYKEEKFGAVLLDRKRCDGLRKCWQACPYGAPQYQSDEQGRKMSKCNMCFDRLEAGLTPICVLSCSMRALEFDSIENLTEKYGNIQRLDEMPKETITSPSIRYKPADHKREIIAWNAEKALALWQKRPEVDGDPLPDVFETVSDVLQAPQEIIGRNRLVLKAENSQDLMYHTCNDE